MAKVYLESTDTAFTISNNNTTVFGASGDQVVTVASGVTGVTYDQNTERVVFAGASSAYTYAQSGNQILVYSGGVLVATIPVQGDTNGTQLTFTDGTANAILTSGVMALGTKTVTGTTTTPAAVTSPTLDTTVVSGTVTGGSVTGRSFTLTTGTDNHTLTSGGNDTVDGSTTADTLGSDTIIDASSADADIINILTSTGSTIAPTTIANVETLNLTGKYGSADLNMTTVTGTKTVNLDSSLAGGSATLTGLSTSTTSITGTSNVSTVSVTGGTGGIAGVAIAPIGATSVTVTDGSSTTAETYSVTMSKAGSLKMDGSPGDYTNTFTGTLVSGTNSVTVTGGSGTDSFTVNLNGGSVAMAGSTDIETLNLSSAGSANTVTFSAGIKTSTGKMTLTGDKDITMTGLAAGAWTGVTVTDSTTAGTTTLKLSAFGTATADLSKVGVDVIQVLDTNNTNVVTLNNGQTLKWSDNATASAKLAASATTDILNITADTSTSISTLDMQFTAATTDFANVKVTNDRTATAQSTTITGILTEANTTLTVLGAGATSIAATSVAKHVDSSGATGKLTVAMDADIQKVSTGTGGSATSIVDVDPTGNYTFTGGTGNDTVTISGLGTFDSTAANTMTIDGGSGGTDVLEIGGTTDFTTTAGLNTAVISGFEQIDLKGAALTLTQKQIFSNGNSFTLNSTGGTGTLTVTVDADSGSSIVDLSSMAFAPSASMAVKLNALTSTANSLTGSAAADSITGGAGVDTLSGNAGVDTITGAAGADVMTGGTGADIFMYTATSETGVATAATSTSTATLDILNVVAGDTINLAATLSTEANYDTFATLVTSSSISLTVASGGTSTIARAQGIYDSTTNTFTVGSSGANAVLVSWSNGDDASADESIVLVGVTDVSSLLNGVITV